MGCLVGMQERAGHGTTTGEKTTAGDKTVPPKKAAPPEKTAALDRSASFGKTATLDKSASFGKAATLDRPASFGKTAPSRKTVQSKKAVPAGKGVAEPMPVDMIVEPVRCILALTCVLLGIWLLNTAFFPLFAGTWPFLRECSTTFSIVTLVVIAFVAARRPSAIDGRRFTVAAMAVLAIGMVMQLLAVRSMVLVPLAIGLFLVAAGRAWVMVMTCVSFMRFSPRNCVVWVATAFVLTYLLEIALNSLPSPVNLAIFAIIPFLGMLLVWPLCKDVLSRTASGDAPSESAITQPKTYLPFSHSLYVTLFVFSLATGFVRTYGAGIEGPFMSFLAMTPLLIILIAMIFRADLKVFDLLYLVAALLIVAGFLMVSMETNDWDYWANTIINAGADCFQVLLWTVLATLASRNENASIVVISWGFAARGLGSGLIGPQLGHLTNTLSAQSSRAATILILCVAFLFVAYNLIVLRSFSFERTIEGVTPVAQPVSTAQPVLISARCDALAEKDKLTPRERDIMVLLASGRNNGYIQEELCLTRNTVKSHIKHIYAKLGIHSQQELIDLVER